MSGTRILGKHEIRRQLGRGATGTVYEGWDPVIERLVAIKTVRLPTSADETVANEIARFRREAQAAGRLTHPNIVSVFDYGETDEVAYIVMEYVDGPTLKTLLDKNEPFPLPRILAIMEDLLTALQFSHERGVVHRDIKPANVMLTARGRVKIADFGVARLDSSVMTQTGTVIGTPAYMSPEQFTGQTADARSDIYSAGVLLYQLLTGERPFDGSVSSIMHKALYTEATPPSRISVTLPARFDAVVQRAMAKRPDDRFASAEEFAAAIREAAAAPLLRPAAPDEAVSDATVVAAARAPLPRPTIPKPEPTAGPQSQPARKRSGAGFVAAGAGVAALVGIGYFLLTGVPNLLRLSHERGAEIVTSPAPVTSTPPTTKDVVPSEPAAPSVPPPQAGGQTPAAPPSAAASPASPAPASPAQAAPNPSVALSDVPPAPAPVPASPPTVAAPPEVAPAANIPPPVVPGPSPLDQLREAARSVPCAVLRVTGDANDPHISGFAHAGPELDSVLRQARATGRVVDEITRTESFTCAPLATIAPLALRSWNEGPAIAVRYDRDPPSGTRFSVGANTTLPLLYVDLYEQDGFVHHLLRPAAGAKASPHQASVMAPGAGPGLLVAIAAERPLGEPVGPAAEPTADYLARVGPQVGSDTLSIAAALAMIVVRPAEPARPRPLEPAVTKEPIVRPPALRSARCSNIVSRAQLGETLSNAELTTLRTECRS